MKFDISKVYTAVNADELKAGSAVIVADTLGSLKKAVENDADSVVLDAVRNSSCEYRFSAGENKWALAYFVSDGRFLKWTDLKIGDCIGGGSITSTVCAIDSSPDGSLHIFAPGLGWLSDEELKNYVLVK